MRKRRTTLMTAAIVAAGLAASPVLAQKSKDTIRLAINDPFSALDTYQVPHEEGGYFTRAMYGVLISMNEYESEFVPRLAKSWKRISPTTLEFELRDDVYFHSGNKFTGEDVKYTFGWLADPKVKIRFKARYTRVKEVQVLDPYKIRIVFKKPIALDLSTIAYRYRIYDSKVHKALEDKSTYGRVSASSTGPYRLVPGSYDGASGFTLERFDKWYKDPWDRAPIGKIKGVFLPDKQTQQAQLFTDGVDVLRDITADDARNLNGRRGIQVTSTESKQITYITLDAAGRSENKAMTDIRVRQAFMKALDREKLIKTFVAGADVAERPRSICFKVTTGCAPTTDPVGYDPEGAKRLLAEAGYPNGLHFRFDVYAPIKDLGEAVAGMLREVGIRVDIQTLPLQVYVKRRGEGRFTAFLGKYPTSAQPDVDNLLNFFFGANRDYYKDPIFLAARKAGETEFDLAKRSAIYTPALNRVNEMSYIYPFTENPIVYAHSADVKIVKNLLTPGEIRTGDFFWK